MPYDEEKVQSDLEWAEKIKKEREEQGYPAYKGPGVTVPYERGSHLTGRKPDLELTGRAAEIDRQWVKPSQQSPDVRVLDTPPEYQGREAEDLDGVEGFIEPVPEDIAALPDDYLFINDDDLTQSGMSDDEAGWTTMKQTDPDKHH